jgi:transcriptional regulator with XRE-family HTH domain
MQQKEHPMASKPYINLDYFEDLTGDIAPPRQSTAAAIGQRIRSARQEKNLSLDQLAQMTGFGVDFLSDIEENRIHPQLGTLIKLSKGLDSAFGRFLSSSSGKPYAVTRKGESKEIARSTSKKGTREAYTYMSLAPEVQGRHMQALMVQLRAIPDQDLSQHDGEEFIFVITGQVDLIIGTDRFELQPGDSAYYLSTTPHLITAKEDSATILAVIYDA